MALKATLNDEFRVIDLGDKILTINLVPTDERSPVTVEVAIHPKNGTDRHVAFQLDGDWQFASFVTKDVRTYMEAWPGDEL